MGLVSARLCTMKCVGFASGGAELATNWFFPSNFTQVKLQPPNIQATNFKQTSSTSVSVSLLMASRRLCRSTHFSSAAVLSVFISCGSICLPPNIPHWKLQVCILSQAGTYLCHKSHYPFSYPCQCAYCVPYCMTPAMGYYTHLSV